MKRPLTFVLPMFLLLFSCLEKEEFTSVVALDSWNSEGLIFTDESGEEFWMGCTVSHCYGFSGAGQVNENILTNLEIIEDKPANLDLSEFLPPIGNQGRLGSCTAWATTYYMRSLLANASANSTNGFNESITLSPSFIYNQLAQGECGGTSISASLSLLEEQGTCTFDLFPYQTMNCSGLPDEMQREEAESYKLTDFKKLNGRNMIEQVKTLLIMEKPIVVAMGLNTQFGKKDGLGLSAYRPHKVVSSGIQGAHAMLVVGYSDEYDAFKLVNSWGEGWGDGGFVWVDYAAFEDLENVNNEFRVLCSAYVGF